MQNTTIQISAETKKKLDSLKEYRRETYNDVIQRLTEGPTHKTKQTPATPVKTTDTIKEPTPTKTQSTPEIEQEE